MAGTGTPADPVLLTSGALSLHVDADGTLRDVRVAGHRALDEVSFSVRDSEWGTAEATREQFDAQQVDGGFDVGFVVRQRSASTDVRWVGRYRAVDSVLVAELAGTVLRDQAVNRAGFTALHALELLGTPVESRTAHDIVSSTFADRVNPHVLFTDATGMVTHPATDATLELAFDGETFETEDHRNWSDAGWKTYCTPLALPVPRHLRSGDVIRQRIVLRAIGGTAGNPRSRAVAEHSSAVAVVLGSPDGRFVPSIGTGVSDLDRLDPPEVEAVAALGLEFLYVELVDGDRPEARLQRATAEAERLRLPLHVGLVTDERRVAGWIARLHRAAAVVRSVSVFDLDTISSSPTLLAAARAAAAADVPLGGGTRGYFAELNRLTDPVEPADFVRYSVSAEVHFTTDERVLDTLRGMSFGLRDALAIAKGRPVHVGPVTLRQRTNVQLFPPPPAASATDDGADVDPRQHTDLAAVWTLGSVAALAGAETVTLFRSVGLRGIVPRGADGATSLRRIVGLLAGSAGLPLRSLVVSEPRTVVGLAVQTPDRGTVAWLGNRTPRPVEIEVDSPGSTRRLRLAAYSIGEVTVT